MPDAGVCEKEHLHLDRLHVEASMLTGDARMVAVREWCEACLRHESEFCHCPGRQTSMFSSQPQPPNLDWYDKHMK